MISNKNDFLKNYSSGMLVSSSTFAHILLFYTENQKEIKQF